MHGREQLQVNAANGHDATRRKGCASRILIREPVLLSTMGGLSIPGKPTSLHCMPHSPIADREEQDNAM